MNMLTCRAEIDSRKTAGLNVIELFNMFNENIKWKDVNWKSIQLYIYDLQYKIFCCTRKNNINLLRHYQRLLVKSDEARFLAVRQVTQDNRGKATAGIDGVSRLNQVPHSMMVVFCILLKDYRTIILEPKTCNL